MDLFEKIASFFSSTGGGDEGIYWVLVLCDTCGEEIRARVNLYNDLSIIYDEAPNPIYVCRKTLVGSQGCYKRVEIKLTFDDKRRLIDREIDGGSFVDNE